MSKKHNQINALDRFVASALMLITPEYKAVRNARLKSTVRMQDKQSVFHIKPEYTQIEGKSIRFARGGSEGKPTILLLNPLPQSIVCYEQILSLIHI